MSTDPSSPSPKTNFDSNVSKKVTEATETDLWDMDFAEVDVPSPTENVQRTPGQLPVQRQSASNISTRKPSDLRPKSAVGVEPTEPPPLNIDVPELPSRQEPEPSKHRAKKRPAYNVAKKTEPGTRSDIEDVTDLEIPENKPATDTREREEPEAAEEELKNQKAAPIISPVGSFSKIEKIAISCLCVALVLGATLTLMHFSNRVPTRPLVAEEIDFPISGKNIEITAASTYWREPITTGDKAEVVRRGTQLIPILKLSLNSTSGAIRVFFRNEDGLVVGDGITRSVKGNAEVTIPATAGFDDIGMHTAYRTGEGKRWIVQVFEASSATSPREEFRKILETDISTIIQ